MLHYKEGEPLKDLSKYLVDGEERFVEVNLNADQVCRLVTFPVFLVYAHALLTPDSAGAGEDTSRMYEQRQSAGAFARICPELEQNVQHIVGSIALFSKKCPVLARSLATDKFGAAWAYVISSGSGIGIVRR